MSLRTRQFCLVVLLLRGHCNVTLSTISLHYWTVPGQILTWHLHKRYCTSVPPDAPDLALANNKTQWNRNVSRRRPLGIGRYILTETRRHCNEKLTDSCQQHETKAAVSSVASMDYMSPKMPANVFLRFFMVSSVSSADCCWLPCRWKGRAGGSGALPVLGALLIVLDCDAGTGTSNTCWTTQFVTVESVCTVWLEIIAATWQNDPGL